MRRLFFSFIGLLVVMLSGMVGLAAPEAQAAPQIATFTTSATLVDRAQLTNRTARVPVSWTTQNRPNTANLVFEQVLADGRIVNVELPRQNPYVASSGDGVAAPMPPGGSATEIVLRVRLVDLTTFVTLSEKSLTVPIGDAPQPTPTIRTFTAGATSVLRSALNNRTARIPVSWIVDNRPNTANLVFEQILDNGSSVNVELPRQNPYVSSSGNGVAAPINPGNANSPSITLRLRLVNLTTGATITQKDLTVSISDAGTQPGVISSFTAGVNSVTRAALTNRTARIPVTWATQNRPNGSNLVFEQVLDNGSVVNVELPRQNPYVASSGNGTAAPVNPGTSNLVRLQVRLVDLATNTELSKRDLTVTISDSPAPTGKIAFFTTTAASVDLAQLASRTARVPVSWSVDGRPQNSNLVFEQVLDNGNVINVELPRQNPIVASSGNGIAAPAGPVNAATATITLRLRLIDLATNATLDTKGLTIPIAGRSEPSPAPEILSFTVTPETASPGATVTLNWQTRNTTAISIGQLPASLQPSLANQTSGSAQVTIPDNASGTVTFELTARNAAGQETRRTLSLPIVGVPGGCPFTDTLDTTCPVSQETVNASFQPFELGYMIWNGNTRKIYVLYNNGSWQEFNDTWQVGDPEPVVGDMPPNLVMPRQGFGKVWEQIGGARVLGFATAQEASYQAKWEMHPTSDAGQTINTPHFTLPDGRVAHLGIIWQIT